MTTPMKKSIEGLIILLMVFAFGACASRSLTPDKSDVKVSKEPPPSNCKSLGKVAGQTVHAKGTADEALQDMINEAAHRSADYLQVLQYSGGGTSVTGEAFTCL